MQIDDFHRSVTEGLGMFTYIVSTKDRSCIDIEGPTPRTKRERERDIPNHSFTTDEELENSRNESVMHIS